MIRKSLTFTLALVLLCSWLAVFNFYVPPVYAHLSSNGSVITTNVQNEQHSPQRHQTYIYSIRKWLKCWVDDTQMRYATSIDGDVWVEGINSPIRLCGDSGQFSIWSNGTHFAYAFAPSNYYVYFRMGRVTVANRIVWCTYSNGTTVPEQTVFTHSGYVLSIPSICFDSSGYPFVGVRYNNGSTYPKVFRCPYTNGTWGNQSNSWGYTLSTTASTSWLVVPVPLQDRDVYCYASRAGVQLIGRLWNSSLASMGSAETISATTIGSVYSFSATARNDYTYVTYTNSTYYIFFRKRWSNGTWATAMNVWAYRTSSNSRPIMSISPHDETLVCTFANTTTLLRSKWFNGTAWQDWEKTTTLATAMTAIYYIQAPYYFFNEKILMSVLQGSSSPYTIKFFFANAYPYPITKIPAQYARVTYATTASITVRWNSSANLDWCGFTSNMTGSWNTNATMFNDAGTYPKWANTTLQLSTISGGLYVAWRMYCNDTLGRMGVIDMIFYHREQIYDMEMVNLGKGIEQGSNAQYFNGTAGGGREAFYYAFQNGNYTPWKYQITAFDLSSHLWVGPYNISDSAEDDTHYAPSISVLPDGRLIYMNAYYGPFNFSISTYSAKTESNLTKLITNWGTPHTVQSDGVKWAGQVRLYYACYPYPAWFDDRIEVFVREGTSYAGNASYWTWLENGNCTFHAWNYTGTLGGHWSTSGTPPYVDDLGFSQPSKMYVSYHQNVPGTCGGNWTFHRGYADTSYNKTYITMNVATEGATQGFRPEVYDGSTWKTDYTMQTANTTPAWYTWNVSDFLNTPTKVNQSRFRLYGNGSTPAYQLYFYNVKLLNHQTGWGGVSMFCYFPGGTTVSASGQNDNDHSLYIKNPIMTKGNNITVSMVERRNNNVTYQDDVRDFHAVISTDRGETWKYANGTAWEGYCTVFGNSTTRISEAGYSVRQGRSMIDQNNRLVALYDKYRQSNDTGYPMVSAYTVSFGSNGLWLTDNCTDIEGDQIIGKAAFYSIPSIDPVYNRLTFWYAGENTGYRMGKWVAVPDSSWVFDCIYNASTSEPAACPIGCAVSDVPAGYDTIATTLPYRIGEFQMKYNSTTQYNSRYTGSSYGYGCKFSANSTGLITSMIVWVAFTGNPYGMSASVAVYNSTWNLLGQGSGTPLSESYTWGPRKAWYQIRFTSPYPSVTSGNTYILCYHLSPTAPPAFGTLMYYKLGYTNQSFNFTWTGSWNSTLNRAALNNNSKQISVYACDSKVEITGFQGWTNLKVGWNNITAWATDIDHTLISACANIQADQVYSQIMIKDNGTEYKYDYGYDSYALQQFDAVTDEVEIYCLSAGKWFHNYDQFSYLFIRPEPLGFSLQAGTAKEKALTPPETVSLKQSTLNTQKELFYPMLSITVNLQSASNIGFGWGFILPDTLSFLSGLSIGRELALGFSETVHFITDLGWPKSLAQALWEILSFLASAVVSIEISTGINLVVSGSEIPKLLAEMATSKELGIALGEVIKLVANMATAMEGVGINIVLWFGETVKLLSAMQAASSIYNIITHAGLVGAILIIAMLALFLTLAYRRKQKKR